MSDTGPHKRESDDSEGERLAKRVRTDADVSELSTVVPEPAQDGTGVLFNWQPEDLLPSSRTLLPSKRLQSLQDGVFRIFEPDVGISEYLSSNVPKIDGIIKQRFTDFLVFEVDLQGDVVHLKSIDKPEQPKPTIATAHEDFNHLSASSEFLETNPAQLEQDMTYPATQTETNETISMDQNVSNIPQVVLQNTGPWPASFTEALHPLVSDVVIEQLKEMFLQGPELFLVSDNGWDGRQTKTCTSEVESMIDTQGSQISSGKEVSHGWRGTARRGRGGRDGKSGRARSGRHADGREDHRRVITDPIPSKQDRTTFHEIIRNLFKGKLETETDRSEMDKNSEHRIVIKWSKNKGSSAKRGSKETAISAGGRSNPFPYIHFTIQKTNRDTQDALSHISRLLHVSAKDLCVAGTKDKRGVTTQRVSFKRNGKSLEDVWKVANGLTGRRTLNQVLTERGERGIRIADLSYRKSFLELGMLKGNEFVITLRNVKVDSVQTIDCALTSLKDNGFINYYGMQRFGTASIPTHSIGLALLRSDWTGAISLILRPRPGEYTEAAEARRAWLDERDLDRALSLMPRRVVAERCILESYKKQNGDDRNALGAISTIPRNLRLMYIHAYQSYVWNAIVSERIQKYGQKPIVGDLVFDTKSTVADETNGLAKGEFPEPVEIEDAVDVVNYDVPEDKKESTRLGKKERRPWQPPNVKVLASEDLHKYSIFDVIMPLPGTDVAYPKGPLGDKYREFLRLDGLDPENFHRKQKDYTLGGSYRKILHLPKHLSWSIISYTDPDVALAQSDEDNLLGYEPPKGENGPFTALQIRMQLGAAAYATMALREVTKTDTSSHHQSILTQASDDQNYRGTGEAEAT